MGRVASLQNGDALPPDLRQRLSASLHSGTKSETAIAAYMLHNLQSLPFETAATAAQKIGVSEASVGRFARGIGYQHFKDLKSRLQGELGDKAWLIGDRLRDFHARSRQGQTEAARALELEIAAIVTVHEIAAGSDFAACVARLAHCRNIHVAGFQTERCHALQLAHGLQYLRAGVHLADLAGGNFADILLADPAQTSLILIDARRYSRLTQELAGRAHAAGIAVTLITDPYCDWGHAAATEVFAVPTDLNHFWDATSPMASLVGQIVNGVFNELGAEVETRMAAVSSLYSAFIGHTGDVRRKPTNAARHNKAK